MHRYRFLLFRPLQLLPVLLGISLITFMMVRAIPGDPARILLGVRSTPAALARIRAQFALDEPLWVQYGYFLRNLLQGEPGEVDCIPGGYPEADCLAAGTDAVAGARQRSAGGSVDGAAGGDSRTPARASRRSVDSSVYDRRARIPGVLARHHADSAVQYRARLVSGLRLRQRFLDQLHHMVLPCLTVALALSAVLIRNLRASLLMEMNSDYVVAARARGQQERRIFWRHVLPNSLVPTINLLAVNIGWLIGSTVVIESVFAIPGLGQLLVKAIFSRDYMVVQGVVMVFALATVVVSLLADILTVALDPRIKL